MNRFVAIIEKEHKLAFAMSTKCSRICSRHNRHSGTTGQMSVIL